MIGESGSKEVLLWVDKIETKLFVRLVQRFQMNVMLLFINHSLPRGPVCVPVATHRKATLSPEIIRSFTVTWKFGSAVSDQFFKLFY